MWVFPCIQELIAVPHAHGLLWAGLPVLSTEKVLLPGPNVFCALWSPIGVQQQCVTSQGFRVFMSLSFWKFFLIAKEAFHIVNTGPS